jgi:hypothetical protein
LRTTLTGTIGSGPAIVDATGGANSTLNIGGVQMVSSLNSATDNGGGAATLTVAIFGSLSTGGGTFAGATNLQAASALTVASGTQKITSTAATVGSGVTVTIASGATLELSGTTSALSDPTAIAGSAMHPLQRAALKIDGTLRVDAGASQEVGGIDPNGGSAGSVVLADNSGSQTSTLTADHINLHSLIIGAGATFTLAPSNASGSPLADASSGGLVLADSLAPSSSFIGSGSSLPMVNGATSSAPAVKLTDASTASVSAVPEPSSAILMLLAAAAPLFVGRRRILTTRA